MSKTSGQCEDRFGVNSFFSSRERLSETKSVKRRIFVFVNVRSAELVFSYLDTIKNRQTASITIQDCGVLLDPVGAVQKAACLAYDHNQQPNANDYDECWVILDKEGVSDAEFQTALTEAQQKNVQVAFGNCSFDLWFLLLFRDVLPSEDLSRHQVMEEIMKHCGSRDLKKVFDNLRLSTQVPQALQRSQNLFERQGGESNSWKQTPSTNIHGLIISIR